MPSALRRVLRRARARLPPATAGRPERTARGRAARHPVMPAIVAMPSANSVGSPRNLLTRKPRIIAASEGSITALVPTRLAITPPRSISPTRMTGTSAAREKPILAISLGRRLTSEALPAPSTSTISASRLKPPIAVEHERHQVRLQALISRRLGGPVNAPLHHDLGADFALRLEQHRIHVNAGRDAGRARLQCLRTSDLAAVRGHGGVVRHVLGLERPHLEAAVRQSPGEAGDHQRLADVRARALKHERAGGQRSELDAGLSFHAGGEMVLHQRHLGNEIGGLGQLRLGIAAGDDDMKTRPALAQRSDDGVQVEVLIAQRDVELVRGSRARMSAPPSARVPLPTRARQRRCRA